MRLDVYNTWTRAHDVPPSLANVFDLELRYPTEAARVNGYDLQAAPDGGWDGWVRMWQRKRHEDWFSFPTGLLGRVHHIARRFGHPYELRDHRVRPPAGDAFGKPIPLRDYQLEAVEKALKAGRGVIDSPPRSGKTRTMSEIVNRLGLPVLWVAPTDRVCKQTLATLEGFFGKHQVTHLVGRAAQTEAAKLPMVVATINTAASLTPEFYETRQALVVDEWHHAAASTYHALFRACPHVFYRWGMTGTHYRSGDDGMAMAALLSNTVFQITSAELLARGYLISTDVCFLPSGAARMSGMGTDWHEIARLGIWDCVPRNQLAARVAAYLAKNGRKVLVLCNRKTQGTMLRDLIKALLPAKHPLAQFEPVEFCSTDMRRHKVDSVVASFNSLSEIKVLIGTSMLGEGVDLPAADALIYARGERAEVSLIQNAFRVCTAAEGKAQRALIVDFADNHNSTLKRHAISRLGSYYGQETFTVRCYEALKPFSQWLIATGHVSGSSENAA